MPKALLELRGNPGNYDTVLHGRAKQAIDAEYWDGNIVCECKTCGNRWQPMIMPGGRFRRNWWKCQYGCGDSIR